MAQRPDTVLHTAYRNGVTPPAHQPGDGPSTGLPGLSLPDRPGSQPPGSTGPPSAITQTVPFPADMSTSVSTRIGRPGGWV